QRPETKVMVNVFVAVDIVNLAALAVLHKYRIRLVVPVIAGYPERYALLRSLVRRRRFRRPLFISCDLFVECFVRHDLSPNQACLASRDRPFAGLFPAVSVLQKTFPSRADAPRPGRGAPYVSIVSARSTTSARTAPVVASLRSSRGPSL